MKTLRNALTSARPTKTPSANLTAEQKNEAARLLKNCPTFTDLLRVYGPDHWKRYLADPALAYTGYSPHLFTVRHAYGDLDKDGAEGWTDHCITHLYTVSSSRDEGQAKSIGFFVQNFTPQVLGYKLGELMLFFGRYATGRYNSGYAAFDTSRIGHCFFADFQAERNAELQAINQRRAAAARTPAALPSLPPCTREAYLQLKAVPVRLVFHPHTKPDVRRRIIDRYALRPLGGEHPNVFAGEVPKERLEEFFSLQERRLFGHV